MKKLQNNFTTPEQSKRLLELGVPADSADCYDYEGSIFRREYNELKDKFWDDDEMVTPCWSVGRLIEIMQICCDRVYVLQPHETDIMQVVFDDICALKEVLDFSKLEE